MPEITDAELSKQVIVTPKRPPDKLYEKAFEKFGVVFEQGVIFTYGMTIHTINELPEDLIKHEIIHVRQQMKMGKDKWWDKYFAEPEFRLSQELEAYQRQYRWAKNNIKDRTKVFNILQDSAKYLSSEMYGSLVTRAEAMKLIQE